MNDKLNMPHEPAEPCVSPMRELIGWVPAALFYGTANFLVLYTLL
jgi:hypothetical protein